MVSSQWSWVSMLTSSAFCFSLEQIDRFQGVHIQEQGCQGRFQLVGHSPDKELFAAGSAPAGVHVGLHRRGHAVKVSGQPAHLVRG